jgi:hypothetical protein
MKGLSFAKRFSMTNATRTNYHRTFNYSHDSVYDADDPHENVDLDHTSFRDYSCVEDFSGDDRPNWRSVIASRGNATNSAVASRKTVEVGSCSFNLAAYRYRFDGGGGNPPVPPTLKNYRTEKSVGTGFPAFPPDFGGSVPNPKALDMAIARFVSNARSRMSPAQGGVILGEIRETLHGIRHPADALQRRLRSYLSTVKKRGRGLRNASTSKKNAVVSQTWLEYSFGWKPLLFDIRNSAEALAQIMTGVRSLEPVRAQGSTRDNYVDDYDAGTIGFSFGSLSYRARAVRETHAYLYGAVDTSIDGNMPTVSSAFGLRPHDIIPTIWELIPYSFVVDYFSNIGDIISCATFATNYLAWWGSSVTTEVTSETLDFHDTTSYFQIPNSLTTTGSCSGSGTKIKHKSFSRVLNPILVPSVHFRIPGVPSSYFNLAALIAQARSIRL